MSLRFEVDVAQNPALGSVALWNFSSEYFKTTSQSEGPSLPLVLLVLPIVLHRRTTEAIHGMHRGSGLLKALCDFPELPAGLQLRVEALAELTMRSLGVGIAGGLLERDADKPWPRYPPAVKSLPDELRTTSEEVSMLFAAARRLGWWFAGQDPVSLLGKLHVRM